MGQLLMKMYPELSCVQSDVLGTGKFFLFKWSLNKKISDFSGPMKNH